MGTETNIEKPASRVRRVRHELVRRELQVVRIEAISPHFRSVTFGGAALAGFVSESFDDHVKFMLAPAGADGKAVGRDYTPRRHDVIPTDYAWHLLVGDETALPAIARRLEELPAGTQAIAILQVADAADRRALRSDAALDVQWVADAPALLGAVRALALPAGEGYAWLAGEAAAMAALRRVLVDEKGHDRHAIRAAAYWKRGATAHHENLED
jgi:NADPH-dependent ferric siderophore reductase